MNLKSNNDDSAMGEAQTLDRADPLAPWRAEFARPESRAGREAVYLCGNSLGLMPLAAADAVAAELASWSSLAVRGHFESAKPWMAYHHAAREPLAALSGANPAEVVAMNSLTVNLHLMLVSFYRPAGARRKIVIESDAFPSDRFAVESQLRWHGLDPTDNLLEWQPPVGEHDLGTDALEKLLHRHAGEIALLLLPGVQYYTGQLIDMPLIARLARRYGVTLGLDLAHAIGNVPLALHDWGVDFAVWCSYKYLNGGPGAVAGAFVHERHFGESLPRLLGWWGTEESTRFLMRPDFRPAPGIDQWQLSNQPILSLAPVIASLDIFHRAGITALRHKSLQLTAYLERRLHERFGDAIRILTPSNPEARGCQLSLMVNRLGVTGQELFGRLEALNVVGDWREPDVIRIAPAPLYNSFMDVHQFIERLVEAVS